MTVRFFNNGSSLTLQSNTQCQCCGQYSPGLNKLCDSCQKDAVSKKHSQELEKVYNLYRENEFSNIIEILKKCNHLTRTKMMYADCLLNLQAYDDLDIFLDNWVEESFIYHDLDGYYVFILRLEFLKRKHTKATEDVYKIIETPDRNMPNEYWALYYTYKATDKFSPFLLGDTPQEYFDLINKALNYAINTQPFYLRGPGIKNNFITYTKNGKQRTSYQIPVDFRLVGSIFFIAGQKYVKLRSYKEIYDVWRKAIALFLQDEWFKFASYTLISYTDQALMQSNFVEATYSTDILRQLIENNINLSIDEKTQCITMILNIYIQFVMPQQGLEYLNQLEQKEEFKNKFFNERGMFYRELGNYKKASNEFWLNYENKVKEKNNLVAAQSYAFYLLCKIQDTSIEPKIIDSNVEQALDDPSTGGPFYKAIVKALKSNLEGKYQESLVILDRTDFNYLYNLLFKEITITERCCCYYNLWKQNKNSRDHYNSLKTMLENSLNNFFILSNFNSFIFRRKIQLLLLQIIGEEKIDLRNEIQVLRNEVQPLGFAKFLEFLESFEKLVANPEKIRKKLEENYTLYLRNINYLIQSKEL